MYSKVNRYSLALLIALAPAAAADADVTVTNLCAGAKPFRPTGRMDGPLAFRCPNGKVAVTIIGLCPGGIVRAYYKPGWIYLTCNSDVNPLVFPPPAPTQTFRLP
jgi:hypothetical protein